MRPSWSLNAKPHRLGPLGHAKNGDFAIPTPNAPKTEALRFARFTLTEAFGSKIQVYAEEALMGFVSMKIGKPVNWIESRRENFTGTIHGRGHVAQRRRGRIEISGTTGSRTTDDTIVCAAFRRLCKSTAPIPMFGRI